MSDQKLCYWCKGPIPEGGGMGKIWLGSNETFCSPKCQHEYEQSKKENTSESK